MMVHCLSDETLWLECDEMVAYPTNKAATMSIALCSPAKVDFSPNIVAIPIAFDFTVFTDICPYHGNINDHA